MRIAPKNSPLRPLTLLPLLNFQIEGSRGGYQERIMLSENLPERVLIHKQPVPPLQGAWFDLSRFP